MARPKRQSFRCKECGSLHAKWAGRCPDCEAWNSIEEMAGPGARSATSTGASLIRFTEVEVGEALSSRPLGIAFLDRVLGGGLPRSAACLLAGEPGIGKSTLLFQMFSLSDRKCLYVSAEESVEQVASRFKHHQAMSDQLFILAESRLSEIVAHIESLRPEIVAIDSIQMILADTAAEKSRGFSSSIRESAEALVGLAKSMGFQLWVVGHVTKDGDIAGPKLLEHLVDSVLTFSQSDEPGIRILQVQKHRFGPSGEIALLSISEAGLSEKLDAEAFWMSKRSQDSPGCAFVPILFGSRVYCVEIQALVTPTFYPAPRRSASGFDLNRLNLICAVLEKHLGLSLSRYDVYLNVVGGIKIQDPVADLACAAAVVSSLNEIPIASEIAFCGELGLTGEIRPSSQLAERSRLLNRLGKKLLVAAPTTDRRPLDLRVKSVCHLRDALGALKADLERQKNEGNSRPSFQ